MVINCSNQPQDEMDASTIHMEVIVQAQALTPFGPLEMGGRTVGCRAYTDTDERNLHTLGDVDVRVAALLHDIANELNPLDVREAAK